MIMGERRMISPVKIGLNNLWQKKNQWLYPLLARNTVNFVVCYSLMFGIGNLSRTKCMFWLNIEENQYLHYLSVFRTQKAGCGERNFDFEQLEKWRIFCDSKIISLFFCTTTGNIIAQCWDYFTGFNEHICYTKLRGTLALSLLSF